jgi:site-specific recombinase
VRQGEDADTADNVEIWSGFRRDAADALMILASHVQAIGLSQGVRQRTATERPLDTPFAGIASAVHDYVEAAFGSERLRSRGSRSKGFVARCGRALPTSPSPRKLWRFDRPRVPARARTALAATDVHARRTYARRPARDFALFVAALIRANDKQDSLRSLLRENLKLMTRRIVESARKTGDHYITRDGNEYRAMVASAAIGGVVTGMTVLVKIATVGHGLPLFIDGVVASINYALSFVLIHLLHGTLATKQPALTAAAMAHQLNAPRARGRLRGFVDEVANLVRSQVAAIMGNLLLVVPAALVLQAILLLLGFGHLPDLASRRLYPVVVL